MELIYILGKITIGAVVTVAGSLIGIMLAKGISRVIEVIQDHYEQT